MQHSVYLREAWDVAEDSASQMRDMVNGMVAPFHNPGKCGVCDRGRRDGVEVDEWHQPERR